MLLLAVLKGDEQEYSSVILDFMVWCEQNHPALNANKTKVRVVDFRRNSQTGH